MLAASGVVVDQFVLPVLRVLEGYWPRGLGWLRRLARALQSWRLKRAEEKLQRLEAKRRKSGLLANEQDQLAAPDSFRRRAPVAPESRMPTRLGNVLRAGERLPHDKYGLDGVICAPRLWLILSEDVKAELIEARRQLDGAVLVLIWGGLLVVWAFLTPWAILAAAAVCAFAYWWAIRSAEIFADLVESAFDLYRGKLYEALRLRKPRTPSEEPASGEALTAYLWGRLPDKHRLEFVDEDVETSPSDESPSEPTGRSLAPVPIVIGALAGLLLGRALARR